MDAEAQFACERIARLARQLLRQERRAALFEVAQSGEHETELLGSSRRITIEGITALTHRVGDPHLSERCSALVAVYRALEATPETTPDPALRKRAVALLVDLVQSLPPPSAIGRLRAAEH